MRLATGIAKKQGGRVAVIDTENGRIRYYANEFDFDDLQLEEPYEPESYTEAIEAAVDAGYETIIIDSITHEWNYCLDTVNKIPGTNSYTKWGKQELAPYTSNDVSKFRERYYSAVCSLLTMLTGKAKALSLC